MDKQIIIDSIFKAVILPLLALLTSYLISFLNTKKAQIVETADNDLTKKYTEMLTETITACVIATNQTYVNELKQKNSFDAEAQKEAFRKTYQAVVDILGGEIIGYLNVVYGDIATYISNKIEAEVNYYK